MDLYRVFFENACFEPIIISQKLWRANKVKGTFGFFFCLRWERFDYIYIRVCVCIDIDM